MNTKLKEDIARPEEAGAAEEEWEDDDAMSDAEVIEGVTALKVDQTKSTKQDDLVDHSPPKDQDGDEDVIL